MKYIVVTLAALAIITMSCTQKKTARDRLVGRWHAIKLENPDMDSFFLQSKVFIDTVGKNNDAATNEKLYGVTNMDSMRQVMRRQYDSVKTTQYGAVNNTTYWFRKDSMAVITFAGSTDSSKWFFSDKGALVLEELIHYGPGERINMEVVSLTDATLKLRFSEDGDTSVVTFNKEGKGQ